MKSSLRRISLGTSIAVLLICLVLVTGSTFSLFTSNSKVDISVTSGTVDVDAIINESTLKTWSRGETEEEARTDGTFANDGSLATIEDGKLVLTNITPGDNTKVTVDVTNNSSVAVAYRLVLTINGELADALDITIKTPAGDFEYGYTKWITVDAGEEIGDIDVKVSFPEAENDNDYQGLECSISFVLEAVQSNGDFVDPITYNEETGVYEVNSEEGMMLMSNIISTVSHGEGRSLKLALTADMDMSGYDWTPVQLHWVNVDGQGHTVSNLSNGFASYIGGGQLTNLTLENVTASGNQAAIVAGVSEGGLVSNVTIAGTNTVTFQNVNEKEQANGIGAVIGIHFGLSADSSVTIAEGATVTVDYTGLKTVLAPCGNAYTLYGDFSDYVTNNGTVKTIDNPIILENGLQMVYGENGEKTLYLVPVDYEDTTVNVPEGVTAIGYYAFSYNTSVETVVLSSTVRDLGRGFDSNSSIKKVVLNEGLETISSRAFRSTSALEEVVISSTVKTIEDNAFQKSAIKTITIPATVETIGETAFGASLVETVIFEGDTSIQGFAFRGCTKLRTVFLYGDTTFIASTLNGRNAMWFCNGESNNPNTSNITFYVTNDTVAARVKTAMGAEANNTPVIIFDSVVSTADELKTALNEGAKTILIDDAITLTEGLNASDVTLIGISENAAVNFDGNNITGSGTITYMNLALTTVSLPYGPASGERYGWYGGIDYKDHSESNYVNCNISGVFTLYCDTVNVTGCTFDYYVQDGEEFYNIFVYGADEVNVTGCTFEYGDRAVKIYNEGGSEPVVNVSGCKFVAAEGATVNKALFEIDATYCTVVLNYSNITVDEALEDANIYNVKGSKSVTINGNKMIANGLTKVDGANTYYVYNAAGLAALNAKMADKSAGQGAIVNIMSDIDFAGYTWTTIDSHADTNFYLTAINGNGHTISNLTVSGQAMFSRFAGFGDVTITDLAFDGAKVSTSTINTALIVGHSYQNLLLDNVDVKNSNVTGGYKVAVLVGTVYNENPDSAITATLKNCDVDACTVTSVTYDFMTCGMVAFVYVGDNDTIVFDNSTISNTVLRNTNSGGYAYHAFLYYTDAPVDDCFNEAEGVTVTDCEFETN